MIISRLRGGLGNQMFQYALGRRLSIKNNTELLLDISLLAKDVVSPRKYELGIFNIRTEIARDNELNKYKKNKLYNKLNKYFKFDKKIVIEPSFNFNPEILTLKNEFLLDGYWQSEKYFIDIRNTLLKDLELTTPISENLQDLLEEIKNSNSISIHIRRGDYATDKKTNTHHGLCPKEYYQEALRLMTGKINNPYFYIFSDDIKWAKENIKINFPTKYIEGNKSFEDFELMKNCKNNIIANSSFSWWAAWLNINSNKIVVSPKKWLNNTKLNTEDVVPEEWIKI